MHKYSRMPGRKINLDGGDVNLCSEATRLVSFLGINTRRMSSYGSGLFPALKLTLVTPHLLSFDCRKQ